MITSTTQQKSPDNKRDESLDYIKGILIFLVVYGHCLYWMGENIQKPYNFLALFIYSFHMPLFIFLSGYFFSPNKKKNIWESFKNKYKRLIRPHLFFNIIMIIPICCFWNLFGHFITRESDGIVSVKSIYLYLTMFWYLWCIFLSSILCNIIYTKISFRPDLFCLFLALLLFTTSTVLPIRFILVHQRMGDMFLYFVIGMIAYEYKDYISTRIMQHIVLISLIIYFTYLCSLYHTNGIISSHIKEIGQLGGIFFMFCFFKLLYKINFAKSYFLFLSKWTLGIYIYHFVLLYAIMRWYNVTMGGFGKYLLIINLATTIISTLILSFFASFLNNYLFLRKYALGNK